MTTFAEKLAAKKAAPESTADVQLLFADGLAAKRDELQAVIDAPAEDERLGVVSNADNAREALRELMATAGDALETIRFIRLPGGKWSEITSAHPPRPGAAIDHVRQYNFDAVPIAAAQYVDEETGKAYAGRVDGDEVVPISAEEWADILSTASGFEIKQIRDTVWGLNEYLPEVTIGALGKAFGATARSGNVSL